MILDFDYLPLPAIESSEMESAPAKANQRAATFIRLDRDQDGTLSRDEFGQGREPAEAKKWFDQRDADADGFVNREEFLPAGPLPKPSPK